MYVWCIGVCSIGSVWCVVCFNLFLFFCKQTEPANEGQEAIAAEQEKRKKKKKEKEQEKVPEKEREKSKDKKSKEKSKEKAVPEEPEDQPEANWLLLSKKVRWYKFCKHVLKVGVTDS